MMQDGLPVSTTSPVGVSFIDAKRDDIVAVEVCCVEHAASRIEAKEARRAAPRV
jgi:hypothetical protein